MLSISVDENRCIGCGLCSLVCSLVHDGFTAGAPANRLVSPLPPSRVIVRRRQESEGGRAAAQSPASFLAGGFRIDICRHCEEPLCAAGCVSGAIYLDKDLGLVDIDRARCVGCWTCVLECPFGAVSMQLEASGREPGRRALKCDGCREAGATQCTRFCPSGALSGGGRHERVTAGRRRAHVVRRSSAAPE